MRVRALDPDHDYPFGQRHSVYLMDSAAAVAQIVLTRLRLWQGEWFLDTSLGLPYLQDILAKASTNLAEQTIRRAILETPDVKAITHYAQRLDSKTRQLTIQLSLQTIYGPTTLTHSL